MALRHGSWTLYAADRHDRWSLYDGVGRCSDVGPLLAEVDPARDDLRSATLISLLAYAGPRPESEALPLRWSSVRRRTILFRAGKRGVPYERARRLFAPLAGDLRTWRQACALPPDDAPVIPSGRGEPWTDYDLGPAAPCRYPQPCATTPCARWRPSVSAARQWLFVTSCVSSTGSAVPESRSSSAGRRPP
jgi:hypothetical protein